MAKPFRGVINVDVTQSVPDWEPYTQPIAPEGTPSMPPSSVGAPAQGLATVRGRAWISYVPLSGGFPVSSSLTAMPWCAVILFYGNR